jgi:hypothetical protein
MTPNLRCSALQSARRGGDDVLVADEYAPAIGGLSPIMTFISVLLPPPGAAQDAEDLAAAHVEAHVLQDGHAVVAGVDVLDADDDVAFLGTARDGHSACRARRAVRSRHRLRRLLGTARRSHMSSR